MLPRILSRFVRGRASRQVPIFKLLALAQVGLLARRHLKRLGPGDARRLAALVRRGRSLDPAEKAELRTLTAKLEPRAFAGAAADRLSPIPLPRRLTGVRKDAEG